VSDVKAEQVEESRTIKTEKLSDGRARRTETIVTTASSEASLEAHLKRERTEPGPGREGSLFGSLFGKPFR
jgi:hypothetical protein